MGSTKYMSNDVRMLSAQVTAAPRLQQNAYRWGVLNLSMANNRASGDMSIVDMTVNHAPSMCVEE